MQLLGNGDVLYISRGVYNSEGVTIGGHAIVIVGYTTKFNNGTINYKYIIYDPLPTDPPDPWNDVQITSGRIKIASYDWVCNGDNRHKDDPDSISRIWNGFMAVPSIHTNDTITPDYNWEYGD